MEFKEYKLEDISFKIGDGIHGTPKYDEIGDYYFINGNNLVDGKILIKKDTKKINKGEYEKHKRELSNRTLLISINGTLGNVAKYNNEKCILGKSACYINLNSDVNVNYVKYVFMSDFFQRYLKDSANGTTIKNVPLSAIRNFVIKLPSLENQNKIVRILSCLDEKIELNNEMIENLQKLSQDLYKRWFIDFEFPNEEGQPYKTTGGKMVNSELGKIPDGWGIGNFNDGILTKIIKSGIENYENIKRYLATADVDGTNINSYSEVTFDERPSRANMQPIKNSVWFAKMQGSIKNILVTDYMKDLINNYIFSTGFLGIECLKNSTNYIWDMINDDNFIIEKDNLSTGTLMAGINNNTISNFKYLIPNNRIILKYEKTTCSINKNIYFLRHNNETLKELRDTLLPKLLSGDIDLDNIVV